MAVLVLGGRFVSRRNTGHVPKVLVLPVAAQQLLEHASHVCKTKTSNKFRSVLVLS